MTSPALRLLLLICVACLLGIGTVMVLVDSRWTAPAAQIPELTSVPAKSLVAGIGRMGPLTHTGQRPIFLASRRPYVPPVAVAQSDPNPGPDPFAGAELLGLFGSGAQAGVILRHEGKTARVGVGAHWSGWELKEVDPRSIRATFSSRDGADHVLRLKRQPQQGEKIFVPQPETPVEEEQKIEKGAESAESESLASGAGRPPLVTGGREEAREAIRQLRQQRANQ